MDHHADALTDVVTDSRLGPIGLKFGVPQGFRAGVTPGLLFAGGVLQRQPASVCDLIAHSLPERGFLTIRFEFPSPSRWQGSPEAMSILRKGYGRVVRKALVHHRWRPGPLFAGGIGLGARVTTHLAREFQFLGLLLLSYPLHPPWQPNAMRHQHLYSLETPMAFISGSRDPSALTPLLNGVIQQIGVHAEATIIQGANQRLEVDDCRLRSQIETDLFIVDRIDEWLRRALKDSGRPAPGELSA